MRRLIPGAELVAVSASTHRAVVRVGAAGAWICTVVFGIAWILTGDQSLLVQSIGPFATSVLYTLQILTKRENAVVALLAGAVVVVTSFSLVGTPDTAVAAIISLWVFAVTATFFVVRRQF